MAEVVIEANNLNKFFQSPDGQQISILKGIDLHVKQGEAVALVGASGSGKSTLLGLLAGLDRADSGRVVLLGQSLQNLSEDQCAQLRLGQVGFVFQSFQLIEGMTAEENVSLPLRLAGVADASERAAETLQHVGLGQRRSHRPAQLSGGEQQRVAIARAFAGSPQILFADEPTGNLDSVTGQQIEELLFRLRDEHQTALLMVTHDLDLARRCDRVYQLQAGVLHEAGTLS